MLDGTNDSAIQRRRRPSVISSLTAGPSPLGSASLGTGDAAPAPPSATTARCLTMTAHAAISTSRTTYPTVHDRLCPASVSDGSSSTGYASSAAMLPRLLAAYRKYGLVAFGCPVRLNHRWSSGAPVDSMKNGAPSDTVSSP